MRVGLVLSGGGARGAYEAGLMAGLVDVLGLKPSDRSPFEIYAGTSVGAINAAYLAGHADRGDHAIDGLLRAWTELSLRQHLKVDTLRFLGLRDRWPLGQNDGLLGRSLLDPKPIYRVIRENIPWDRLHRNVRRGVVKSLVVPALHISSGRTHLFAELAPGETFRPSKAQGRQAICGEITSEHVLASSSLPLIFPACAINGVYYCDGGLRLNTPLASAIRSGADRMVVVPLLKAGVRHATTSEEVYPNPFFLLGKLLNALLLDPIAYDLKVLERFNSLIETLDATLSREQRAEFDSVVTASRGAPYRRIETLAFHPTEDLGRAAGDFLAARNHDAGFVADRLLRKAAVLRETYEADLVSFLLFDGRFAKQLIDLGRRDAELRASEIRSFFS